eukprot:scaffold17624_cov86-Skeletonema_marinoi.AAC.1
MCRDKRQATSATPFISPRSSAKTKSKHKIHEPDITVTSLKYKMLWNNRAVLCNAVAVVTRLSTASSFSPMAITTTRTFAQTTSLYSAPPKRYLLNYEYIPDVLEKRGPYREGHLGLAKEMAAEGTCVSGGPFNPPGSDIPNG